MAKPRKSSSGVGYANPPHATRFKPGQSGNPKGRPKGSKNLAAEIEKEERKRISITEDGKRRRITKKQAIAIQLVNGAVVGDPKVTPLYLKEAGRQDNEPQTGTTQDVLDAPEDALVMASIVQRIRQMEEPPPLPKPVPEDPAPPADPRQSNPHEESLP
jgi:hypothetical protein